MTVVRYVERNPLRAGLVDRAEDWPWSSLGASRSTHEKPPRIEPDEMLRRGEWTGFVNTPMTEAEAEVIRLSIRRDRPFGTESWTRTKAESLGLGSSLRSRGGQRKRSPAAQAPDR